MSNILIETNFSEVEALTESTAEGKPKEWFIHGIFAQGDVVNKNRRVYPGQILEQSMNDYNNQYVMKNRAVGEAEHPTTTQVNIDRISHVIVPGTLLREGKNWSAKAKVLNTPCGNIVKGLLEGGVQIGVSTRADGAVKRNTKGIMEVQEGLKMSAIDVVFSPSAPDALVAGLMENQEYIWDSIAEADKQLVEDIKNSFKKLNKNQLNEGKLLVFKRMMEIIRNGQ